LGDRCIGSFRFRFEIGQLRDQLGGPADPAGVEPGDEEALAPMLGEDLRDQRLVGLGRGGAEREADLG
jgi:hypothetical protein